MAIRHQQSALPWIVGLGVVGFLVYQAKKKPPQAPPQTTLVLANDPILLLPTNIRNEVLGLIRATNDPARLEAEANVLDGLGYRDAANSLRKTAQQLRTSISQV